jgi:hypothetical protein
MFFYEKQGRFMGLLKDFKGLFRENSPASHTFLLFLPLCKMKV